jgi:hypothetical protein
MVRRKLMLFMLPSTMCCDDPRMSNTVTREELYALVSSEPIQKIAPKYGLSDRRLGKLCERHDITVPPRV